MAEKIGSLAVSLSLDSSEFNGGISQVNRNLSAMGSELKASKNLGTDYGKSLQGLTSKKEILARSVEAAALKLQMERKTYDELTSSGKANEIQTERQAKRVNEAQAQYNRLNTELASVEKTLKTQSSAWYQAGDKMENAGNKFKTAGEGMTKAGDTLTKKVSLPLAALGAGAFKAAVDFESAFAGVRKTVDMSETEFATLSKGIRDMSKELPSSASEIAKVAEAAGQLGIKNDAILGFTRTMTDLGVATNMSSDEAATSLARLANITQMNQKDFDRLGSSIVALGNNFATTEREIVDMSLRLAGAGAQVGMSEADIVALATALSSVGIEAEMGGSAISRVMVAMQVATSTGFTKVNDLLGTTGYSLRDLQMMASHSGKAFGNLAEDLGMTKKELSALVNSGVDLENFASVAGLTGEQFKKAFEEDAVGAIGLFVEGLSKAGESGGTAVEMLQEMGITEIRLRDSLLRAGGASELFTGAIKLSNDAWDENNALTKEAEERYKTTASQLKILWNQIVDVGISFGSIMIPMAQDAVAALKPLIERFGSLTEEQQKTILAMGGIAIAAGPVLKTAGSLSSTLGNTLLVTGHLSKGIAGAGGLGASLAGLAGPVGIAVGAVAAVGIAGYGLYTVLNKTAIPEIDIFGNKVSENTQKAVSSFMELNNEATVQLNQLKWSGMTVSEEMATAMIETYNGMGEQILSKMQQDHASQMESARNYLSETVSLSKEEQTQLLATIEEGQATRETSVQTAQTQYNSILKNAADERRSVTTEEKTMLDSLQKEMMETGIKYLSETEAESLMILERLKAESGKISAEQAIETAKHAKEAKDAAVEAAEKKYDETIKWALLLKQDGTKESKDLADKIIKDAERTRDDSVAAANGQYDQVIRVAKQKGGQYVTETELHLGQSLTLWEKAGFDVARATARMSVDVLGHTRNMLVNVGTNFTSMKKNAIQAAEGLVSGVKFATSTLPAAVGSIVSTAAKKAGSFTSNFIQAGKDMAAGMIIGIREGAIDVAVAAGKMALDAVKAAKRKLESKSPSKVFIRIGEDVGNGFAIGIASSKNKTNDAISGVIAALTKTTKTNAQEVTAIATEAEKQRTAIQKEYAQKRTELAKKTDASAISAIKKTKNKKGQIVITGTEKVHKIRSDASAKLIKLNDDEQKKLMKINDKAWDDMQKKEAELSKARLETVKSFVEEKKSVEQLSLIEEANIWRRSINYFKEGTKEKTEAQKQYKNSIEAINKEITSINKEYEGEMQKINENLIKGIDDVTKAYQDAEDKRTQSLQSFAGIFDEFKWDMEKSGQELTQNLQSQVEGFKTWQTEIEKLASKAVDEGLIAELREMGPKALPQLLALNSLTDEQLTNYSNLYKEKMALAREQAQVELIGMKVDTENQITEMRKAANEKLGALQADWTKRIQAVTTVTKDEFKTLTGIGKQAGQNLLNGLASMESSLVAKARAIAKAVNDALQSTLGGSVNIPMPKMPAGRSLDGGSSVTNQTTNNSPTIVNNYYQPVDRPSELARKQTQNMRDLATQW